VTRFSLKSLFVAVALVALAITAFAAPDPYWAELSSFGVVCCLLFLVGDLVACEDRGRANP
jgi:hypothetical protein